MVTGLLAYIMNYIIGKNKNSRLAQAWFNSHRELLESNFTLVGKLSWYESSGLPGNNLLRIACPLSRSS